MKANTLLIFLISLAGFSLNAQNYYIDGDRGNDANSGLTGAPWKTIARVNEAKLLPGDSILFARGQVFRGNLRTKSGSSSKHIVYGAFGSGSKPLLLGSVNRKETSDWKRVGTNLWSAQGIVTLAGEARDAGCIVFDDGASVGWKVSDPSLLSEQGRFFSDIAKKSVCMYSVNNPGSVYSNIEIALKKGIIAISNQSFVDIENLELRYGAAHGISGENTHHIRIKNVDMKFIGGGYQTGTTRYGNGVEFWNNAHDNRVDYCSFSQIYDAALTNQGIMTEGEQHHIYYTNNRIDSSEYSFEIWLRVKGASIHDIYFENNTCMSAGMGWGNEQRTDPNGSHLCFWGYEASVMNIFIRNNTFGRVNGGGIFVTGLDEINVLTNTIDFNNWASHPALAVMSGWDDDKHRPIHTFYDWESYREISGQDKNSHYSERLLIEGNVLPHYP